MKNTLMLLLLVLFACSMALAEVDELVVHSPFYKNTVKTISPEIEKTAPNLAKNMFNIPKDIAYKNATIEKQKTNKIKSNPQTNSILQGGDTVNDATAINSLDYNDSGTISGYTDDYDEICPYTTSNSPDVVYSYTPSEDVYVDISLYGSDYDTKMFVYENEVTEGFPYACNDDYYSDYTSALIGLEFIADNTYYIVIDGFCGAEGNYVLAVTVGDSPMDICPDGSLFTQSPNYPDDISWNALISDVYGDEGNLTAIYENYSFDSGSIGGITFCGFTWQPEQGYFTVCTDNQPLFDVVFYDDDNGAPGVEVAAFDSIEATISETGYSYSDYDLYQYTIDFSTSVDLVDGWVMVRGNGEPESCIFYWVTSNSQDNFSYVDYEGELYEYSRDFAFCLLSDETGSTGENCDDPIVVDSIPFSDEGNTCNYEDDCDINGDDSSDVIYEMVISETNYYSVSLTGSEYDTKLAIYLGECCGDESWAYNDDYDGNLTSQINANFEPGTYYIVVDGYGTSCGNYILTIQESAPVDPGCYHDYADPDSSWTFMESDTEFISYKVYDNFQCDDSASVNAITFWGANLRYDTNEYYQCEEDPTEMEVTFYPDVNGEPDVDNPTCAYTITPEITNTGVEYQSYSSTYELLEYYATLDEPCEITSGWISIQGTSNNGDTCMFMWISSYDGDNIAYRYANDYMSPLSYDFAMELDFMVDIEDEAESVLPTDVYMLTCYPNPFNPTTTMSFTLANSGNVAIDIFDVLGRRIDKLNLGYLTGGQTHSVGYDAGGLATGVYFYSLEVDGQIKITSRFNLLK